MVNREKDIEGSLENAKNVNRQADERLADYEKRLAGVEEESRQILKSARDQAKVQATEIIHEADEKARILLEHSQKEIRRERYNARKELQEEVGSLAVLAAEKILERELSGEDHQDIVGRIIREAEKKPWN